MKIGAKKIQLFVEQGLFKYIYYPKIYYFQFEQLELQMFRYVY